MSLCTTPPIKLDNSELDLAIRQASKLAEEYENNNQHKTAELYRHHHTLLCAEKVSRQVTRIPSSSKNNTHFTPAS